MFDKLRAMWKESNVESFFSTSHLGELIIKKIPSSLTLSLSKSSHLKDLAASKPTAEALCLHDHSKNSVLIDKFFRASISQVWGLLYGDRSSFLVTVDDASDKLSFLHWFLTVKRSCQNFKKTTWIVNGKEELESLSFEKAKVGDCRTLVFDMDFGLQRAGSKQICTVKSVEADSICIDSITTNSGTPFASSYYTLVRTCIRKEGHETRLLISYLVVFDRDCYSIIKTPVQNAIKSRIPEFYDDLALNLEQHFEPQQAITPQLSFVTASVENQGVVKTSTVDLIKHERSLTEFWFKLLSLFLVVVWLAGLIYMYLKLQVMTAKIEDIQTQVQTLQTLIEL